MTKQECKEKILGEWQKWARDPNTATYAEMQSFYSWLEENNPELLSWRLPNTGMDRWQDVRGWLNTRTNYGRIPS